MIEYNSAYVPTELDAVDRAIIGRDTLKSTNAWSAVSQPKNLAETEMPWEDIIGWLANKPTNLEYVPRGKEGGIIEPLDERFRAVNSYMDVPLNKVGVYFSKNFNLEHLCKNALFDPSGDINTEISAWIEFLSAKGYKGKGKISKIGTENMKNTEAMIYRAEKESYITFSNKMGRIAESKSDKLGIDSLDYKMYVLFHELGHHTGVDDEAELGYLMAEYYGMMAEKYKGTEKESVYRALAEEAFEYAERNLNDNSSKSPESKKCEETKEEGLSEDEKDEGTEEGAKEGSEDAESDSE